MLKKRKNPFIEINFAPHKKRKLFAYFEEISLSTKDSFLYWLSLIAFLFIFITPYLGNKFLQQQKAKVVSLNRQIYSIDRQIRALQRELATADNRFKVFYIPKLKEKLFILWYKQWYKDKVISSIKKFQTLIGGFIPYLGVWVYPNPSVMGKAIVETSAIPKGLVIYKKITKNPFTNPNDLNYVVIPSLFLYVKSPKVDSKFNKLISRIRDNTIKANLLLEYTLLKHPLKAFSFSSVALLMFPINIAKPSKMEPILQKLKNYCSALIINKEAKKSIYLNNKWQTSQVLDGVCIKYVF